MKWKLFLLCMIGAAVGMAQNPISANIVMPATMPANTQEWGSLMPPITIQASARQDSFHRIPIDVEEAKVLVTIKSGGGKVCGSYVPNTAPDAGFSSPIKIYRGADVNKLIGQNCILKPGSYSLCVQFFSSINGTKALSEEVCKQFSVAGTDAGSFTPPQNLQPVDGKVFTEIDARLPLTFRWTPILPRPQEPTVYKLKVWELKDGKTATTVVRNEQALIQEEVVDQTQFVYRKGWDGKGNYIWQVDAMNKEGKVLGSSLPTAFTYASGGNHNISNARIESITCIDYNHVKICGNYICVQSGYGPSVGYTQFPTQINNAQVIALPSNRVVGLATSLGTVNEGGSIPICITTSAIPLGTTYLSLSFDGTVLDPQHPNMVQLSSADTTMPDCKCKPCEQNNVRARLVSSGYYQDIANVVTTITASPNNISKIQADLVYIRVTPKNPDCVKCDKKTVQQGNFTDLNQITQGNVTYWKNNGAATYMGENSTANAARSVEFSAITAAGVNIGSGINIRNVIGLPPVSCCGDEVEIWIRYTVWDINCHACDNLVKTTIQRAGSCTTGTNGINIDNPIKK